MATWVTTDDSMLLDANVKKIFFENYTLKAPAYMGWNQVSSMKGRKYTEGMMKGLPALSEVDRLTRYNELQIEEIGEVTITPIKFGAVLLFAWEDLEDDPRGILRKAVSALGRAARERVEIEGAYVLNHAFDGAVVGADGLGLCVVNHVTDIGLQANRPAVAATFDPTSIQTLWLMLELVTDEAGKDLSFSPRKIVAHPTQKFKAKEIFGSARAPYLTTNEINVLEDTLKFVECRKLSDQNAWFMMDESPIHFKWRYRPQVLKPQEGFSDDSVQYKIRLRLARGFVDYKGVVGTPGS